MAQQLVLPLKLNSEIDFSSYVTGANAELILKLKNLHEKAGESFYYLWGANATGKSHLLQALCNQFLQNDKMAFYLDCQEYESLSPEIFESLEHYELICLDNIGCLQALPQWEEALFHLYNRIRDNAHVLVVTSELVANAMKWHLQDIRSRLNWGLTYHILGLDDAGKISALQLHAEQKGMHLSDEVCNYLLNHFSRDMNNLMTQLKNIETQSLILKKRITIPFVKSL